MDEFAIEVLKANGYDYDSGGIIDAEGNFLSSVELNGKTYTSEADPVLWEEAQQPQYRETGAPDPVQDFRGFEADPLGTALTPAQKENYPMYAQIQEEQGLPTYDDANIYEKEMERQAEEEMEDPYYGTLRELQEEGHEGINDELINKIKENEKFIAEVEAKDPSWNVNIREKDDTDEQIEDAAMYNVPGIAAGYIEKGVMGLVKWANSTFYGESAGMNGTKEEKLAYEKALQDRKEMKKPAARIMKAKIDEKLAELNPVWEEMSMLETIHPDNDIVRYAINELEQEKALIDNSIDEQWIFNPLSDKYTINTLTAGFQGVIDKYMHFQPLANKVTKGEELTENEQLAAEALGLQTKTQGMQLEQHWMHGLTKGTFDSAAFLYGGAVGRVAMKGVTKAVTTAASKQVGNLFGNIIGGSVNMTGQAILHPESHIRAIDKYYGSIAMDVDAEGKPVLTTDRRTYATLMEEMTQKEDELEEMLLTAKDPDMRRNLQAVLKSTQDIKNGLVEPETLANSIGYGFTSVLTENTIENYGLKIGKGLIKNPVTKKLASKNWVKSVAASRAAKGTGAALNKVDNLFMGVKRKFNAITGDGGSKLVGGNFEEMGEEVATQLVPVWGETDEEAIARKGELLELSFYGQVAGQTLLMGGLMKGVHAPAAGLSALQNSRNKDVKKARQAYKDLVKEFGKGNITEAETHELLMKAGGGKFTVQEYNNKINQLKAQGDFAGAADVERNKTFNIGKEMIKNGKGKQFVRDMNRLIANGTIPAESTPAVMEAVNEIKKMNGDMSKHGDLRNKDFVLELKSKQRYTANQKKKIKEEMTRLQGEEVSPQRDGSIKGLETALANIETFEGRLNKQLRLETSEAMRDKLQKEAEITQELVKNYKKHEGDKGTGYVKITRKEAIDKMEKKYGNTIQSSVKQMAKKNLDRYILNETIDEHMKKFEAMPANKPNETETKVDNQNPPEDGATPPPTSTPPAETQEVTAKQTKVKDHVDKLSKSIDDVTAQLEQQQTLFDDEGSLNLASPDTNVPPTKEPDTDPAKDATLEQAELMDTAFFDDMPKASDGKFENEPFQAMVDAVKTRVKEMEEENGEAPTFDDYVDEMLENGDVEADVMKGHMRALGLAWDGAQLGKSNWKKSYNERYASMEAMLALDAAKRSNVPPKVKTDEEIVEEEKEQEQVAGKKTNSEPITYNPDTGEGSHVTPNKQKHYGTEHKANFSAIQYEEEITIDENGKEVRKKVNAPVPQANMESSVNWWDLVNPNKNNIGDKLIPTLLEGEELANTDVAVRDERGIQIPGKSETFEAWTLRTMEEKYPSLTFEQFQETQEYKDKVPMVYKDSNGSNVAYVPEVMWFNANSVGDPTDVEEIDLNNPTAYHQKLIDQNREQARALRNGILSGDVVGMEIADNLSMPPFIKMEKQDADGMPIPTAPLNQMHPDTRLVQMNPNGQFYGLDGVSLKDEHADIINYGDDKSGLGKMEMKQQGKAKSQVATNKGHYYALSFIGMKDGRKQYIAIELNRKKEDGLTDGAHKDDIETARWIAATNKITKFPNSPVGDNDTHPNHMTKTEAEALRRQILEVTGIDVKDKYADMLEARVAHHLGGFSKKTTFGKDTIGMLLGFNETAGTYTKPDSEWVSNMKFKFNAPMVTIKRNPDRSFEVKLVEITPKTVNGEKVTQAKNYEDFLKERLSSNVMGFNVGTEANPVFTAAPQQRYKLTPILKDKTLEDHKETFKQEVEDLKQDEKVEKKTTEVETKDAPVVADTKIIDKAKRKEAMTQAAALAKRLNLNIEDISEIDNLVVAEMATTEQVEKGILSTPGLTIKQEEQVVDWLFSQLSSKEGTYEDAKHRISGILTLNVEELNQSISDLQAFKDNPVVLQMILNMEQAVEQQTEVLNSLDELVAEAGLRAVNVDFVSEEFDVEEWEENIKDFSKGAGEVKSIDKVGTALKRIFAQVSDGQTGFMGLETFPGFKRMYDTVTLALSADTTLEPNFEQMMEILKKRKDSTPWMTPLIEALEASDKQTQNQFVYNTYQQKVYAKFAALSMKNKAIDSRVLDSNANEAKRQIQEKWRENFKRSPINNEGLIDKGALGVVIEEWNRWQEEGVEAQSDEVLQNFLSKFGIELSQGTWDALRANELNVSEGGGKLKVAEFKDLFSGLTPESSSNRTGFLFTNLVKYALLNESKKGDIEFYEATDNHPFKQMSTILNQLSELEAKYNPTYGGTSRYVAGKSVTEMEQFTYFYEQFKKLKNSAKGDKAEIAKLQNLSFSQDSFLLDLLTNDPVFAEQFQHGLIDLMALKELYKQSPLQAGIDELSGVDYRFTQRALFQDRKQGSERTVEGQDFDIRMAHMNTLTNSDKGRMMLLKTAVFDFYKQSGKAFKIEDGEVTFTEELNNLLYKQLVMPELRRIVNYINNGNKSTIDSYDAGATRFNILSELNTLTDANGLTFVEAIVAELDKNGGNVETTLTEIEKEFKGKSTKVLEQNVVREAKDNVKDISEFAKKKDQFNNADYLAKREGTVLENMLVAELDFTLNSMLTNMNYMQMMTGDPALYYKKHRSDEVAELNDSVAQEKMSQRLAINLGKRMAAMIAPGSVLADSHDNKYIQVFLDDMNGPTENLLDIIEMHYGEKAGDIQLSDGVSVREAVELTKKGTRDYVKQLEAEFPRIAEFIDIESTDAQEYTTLEEHLHVMDKQGRISQKLMTEIKDKIKKGEDLTKEQLDIVMQPIKPVYTGTQFDADNDVNRMMYIKSSSFPLIPQLTKGRELDKLRVNMEEVEASTGKTVRAAYHSAVKVGGMVSENRIKSFDQPILPQNTLTLNREHFKIQQDVPFKSKEIQDDKVSMGTQIFKLLMGDGIMEMDGFMYQGKPVTGKQLQAEFHSVFAEMVGMKKDKFLRSLGYDENMETKDPVKTMQKLEALLKKEAKSRGFSKQDLKILDLVDGASGKTFKLPLWLTGNSNKYESMLNAMINNKIFKQKIPGNKFVTGSEAGFQVQENMEGIDKSRIVHLGNFNGDVLQSGKIIEGEMQKAQVLLPSKFKLGGKLIDLFEEFDNDKGDGVYLKRGSDGVVRVKEHMVDKKLLEQFTFRIPTSSHGLGSSIEVVGFLPPESGDLIVTPKGFIAQMGQDFDIDSLTAYQYNHIVMATNTENYSEGSIHLLTEETREAFVQEKEFLLNTLRDEIKKDGLGKIIVSAAPTVEKPNNALMATLALVQETGARTEKEILDEIDFQKSELRKDFDLKLLENKFIEIHNSVYSNPQAQKQIQKVLSMATAEQQADEIQALQIGSGNSFNILSPRYQQMKLNAGSTGQVAIGIYAKGLTLHSLVQQASADGSLIRLGTTDRFGKEHVKKVTIGNLHSEGVLGRTDSIKSKGKEFDGFTRRISTILDERANTATDNEKAQILGRTGLNYRSAIGVDSLLSMLGFDLEYTRITKDEYIEGAPFHRKAEIDGNSVYYLEHSLPYLLHSQPIIREYFELIAKKGSQTTDFSADAKKEAQLAMLKKYGEQDQEFFDGKVVRWAQDGEKRIPLSDQDNTKFTSKFLADQIELNGAENKTSQLQILALYVDLINQSEKQREMMSHVDLQNLGKSMWESTTRAKEFRKYFYSAQNRGMLGAEKLIGRVVRQSTDPNQIPLGDGLILEPTTNQGVMVGTALGLSEALFTNVFPAKNVALNNMMDDLIAKSNVNVDNINTLIDAKEKVFQEVKKYLTSAKQLGIFGKSASEVRRELMTDREGNQSLSSYIGNMMTSKSTEHADGIQAVQTNLFLNLLKTVKGENGKPSLLTFNNNESFEANQEAIYASFKELIAEDKTLPRVMRNGKSEYYSTRILAQELIAYSYATGGVVQGAVQFHKFLPIEYLDDMTRTNKRGVTSTISENMRKFNSFHNEVPLPMELEQFERQYFQNNPDKVPQSKMKEIKLEDGTVLYETLEKAGGQYLAVRQQTKSKLKSDKWKLYEKIIVEDSASSKLYREISVLGDTGMTEYEFGLEELSSVVNEKVAPIRDIEALEMETISDEKMGEIPADGSTIVSFLDAIENGEYGEYGNVREIAKYLKQFVTDDQVFTYTKADVAGRVINGHLTLNPDNIPNRNILAPTFIHEVAHVITQKLVNQHLDEFGELKSGAPAELVGLNNVLTEYKKQIIADNPVEWEKFQEKLIKYKEAAKQNIPWDGVFTQMELDTFYPATNLHEFIATSLGNNQEFIKKAKSMSYLESGQTIMQKFGSLITNFIKRIGKMQGIPENSVALQAIQRSMGVVEAANRGRLAEIAEKVEAQKEPDLAHDETAHLVEKFNQQEPDFDESFYQGWDQTPDNLGDPTKDNTTENTGDPSNDIADENSISMLPVMIRTKNKCN